MKLSRQKISRLLKGSTQSHKKHRKRAKPVRRRRRHGSNRLKYRTNLRQRTMKRHDNLRGGAFPAADSLAAQLQDAATNTANNQSMDEGVRQIPGVLMTLMKYIKDGKGEVLDTSEVRNAWNQLTHSIDSLRGNYYSQSLAKAVDASSSATDPEVCEAKSICSLIAELNKGFDDVRKELVIIKPEASSDAKTSLVVAQWSQRVYDLVRSSTAQNDYNMFRPRSMLVADASANASMYIDDIVGNKSAQSMATSDKTLYKLGNNTDEYKQAVEDWVKTAASIGNKTLEA